MSVPPAQPTPTGITFAVYMKDIAFLHIGTKIGPLPTGDLPTNKGGLA